MNWRARPVVPGRTVPGWRTDLHTVHSAGLTKAHGCGAAWRVRRTVPGWLTDAHCVGSRGGQRKRGGLPVCGRFAKLTRSRGWSESTEATGWQRVHLTLHSPMQPLAARHLCRWCCASRLSKEGLSHSSHSSRACRNTFVQVYCSQLAVGVVQVSRYAVFSVHDILIPDHCLPIQVSSH